MSLARAEILSCRRLVRWALKEDLGKAGDVTARALIPANLDGQAVFVARTEGVVCGLPAAEIVFAALNPRVHFHPTLADGAQVQPGQTLARVSGLLRAILAGERTALNFLQRLSGIASITRRYVQAVAGLSCRILDTRKTTPGWRLLEKYAVRCGGGGNHRLGLYDGILIKDNHLAALGGAAAIAAAIQRARKRPGRALPIEIEVDTLDQLDAALSGAPDIVLLDNMSTDQLREAVQRRNRVAPKVALEASGGVTLATVRAIAETGVERISVGALTHSAPALDIALDYTP